LVGTATRATVVRARASFLPEIYEQAQPEVPAENENVFAFREGSERIHFTLSKVLREPWR